MLERASPTISETHRSPAALAAEVDHSPVFQFTLQEAPTDHSAPQGQKCLVDIGPLFVAHAQPPKLIQPSECPLHDPAPSPQSATVFCIALRKKRDNASVTQTLPDRLRVTTTSPNTQSGRCRGRPRFPCKLGTASTSASACWESLRFAPVR